MNPRGILILLFIMLIAITGWTQSQSYNIVDFGAKDDSLTINTKSIQRAVDKCSSKGGGQVLVPPGTFLTGTIILKNNVTIHLSEGARLLGSTHIEDYKNIDSFTDATGQKRGNCLLGAVEAKNVGITGTGTIDGQGDAFRKENLKLRNAPENAFTQRPFLVRFVRSTGINISHVNMVRPAAWTLHFYQSKQIKVNGISINSHVNGNNDGIDIDSSSDMEITNCDIDSGDDAICFKTTSPVPTTNIHVSDCRISSGWGAIKFGTESMGNFENITIEKCTIYNTKGGGIKILSVDGANIKNIKIRDITMDQVDMPLFIRLGERQRTYRDAPIQPVGTIDGISIQNVKVKARTGDDLRVSPSSAIFITGTPDHDIKNIMLENIEVLLPGGGTAEMADIIVKESIKAYPEYKFFGILPAHAIYSRHIDGLYLKNVSIKTIDTDLRPVFIFDDVKNVRRY